MPSLRARAAFALAAAVAFGCGDPADRTALDVTITLKSAAKSACVVVEAGEQRSSPVPVAGKPTLHVGVVKTRSMPASIPVVALGYADAECRTRTSPTEQSAYREVAFVPGEVLDVELVLGPVTGPTDLDGDGAAVPQDCDDRRADVHPGATEACWGEVDEDCDGLFDCKDPGCDSLGCGAGAACGTGACRETACDDGADNDRDALFDCADADCGGRPCLNGGTCAALTCQGATTEAGLCADGIDNDLDLQADCADPDCQAAVCSDGAACTKGELCQGGLCQGGAPVTCPAVGPTCTLPGTGACQAADGGCAFSPKPADAGCDDGDNCTVTDRCNGDGGCAGLPVLCVAPPSACHNPTGLCQSSDGGCGYGVRPAGSAGCDDGDNCTLGDSCDGDGGCKGAPVTCSPPPCSAFSGACTDGGACLFSPTPGAVCDGGRCNGQGTCAPAPAWPYTPSNFAPNQAPTPSNAVVLDCVAVIRTQYAAPVAVFEAWCPGAVQPSFTTVNSSGTDPVLFSSLGLTVGTSGVLRIYGDRPVIWAVQGDVHVDGELHVGAVGPLSGAGGNRDCPAGARPTPGVCDSASCGGGAGAGYGSAGRDGGRGEQTGAYAGRFGQAWGTLELVPLLGGCAGAPGGAVLAANMPPGGGGGGALQLSATGSISITDRVTSVGGGGRGAPAGYSRGGGGGGSGGALLFEANGFDLASGAWISCNGGGGGESSDNNSGAGDFGDDGRPTSTSAAAGGSGGANNGGNGGGGATSTTAPTDGEAGASSSEQGGGGGGGAGLGRVRLNVVGACATPGTITAALSVRTSDGGACP